MHEDNSKFKYSTPMKPKPIILFKNKKAKEIDIKENVSFQMSSISQLENSSEELSKNQDQSIFNTSIKKTISPLCQSQIYNQEIKEVKQRESYDNNTITNISQSRVNNIDTNVLNKTEKVNYSNYNNTEHLPNKLPIEKFEICNQNRKHDANILPITSLNKNLSKEAKLVTKNKKENFSNVKIYILTKLDKLYTKKQLLKIKNRYLKDENKKFKLEINSLQLLNNNLQTQKAINEVKINDLKKQNDKMKFLYDEQKLKMSNIVDNFKKQNNDLDYENKSLEQKLKNYKNGMPELKTKIIKYIIEIQQNLETISVNTLFDSCKCFFISKIKYHLEGIDFRYLEVNLNQIKENFLQRKVKNEETKRLLIEKVNTFNTELQGLNLFIDLKDKLNFKDIKIRKLKHKIKKLKSKNKVKKIPNLEASEKVVEKKTKSSPSESDIWECFK